MHTAHRSPFARLASLARTHDDLPAFNAAYWVLTLLAAMLFNAGAFALLIAGHVALDVYKYRDMHKQRWSRVIDGVFKENLLDVSVLSLGVAFSVYFHSALPLIAGLRGLLRTEITLLNAIVQVTVKAHIFHNVLTVLSNVHQYLEQMHPHMGKHVTVLESVAIVNLVTSVALTLIAPWVLNLDVATMWSIAEDVFVPWRI